ncbi:DUF4189 domain-containing protein [Stenotrophomonas daejeonensis]|uniref:DUF4189 domain-containing protein n=1 Tax=Stenotrophomonas daejeonensis TaxID=659018 RepID=UPI001379B473
MRNFYYFLGLLAVYLITSFDVRAEGRCPPGQYPIGDSRAPGCAPIPGYGGQVGSTGEYVAPLPIGEWLKTWGAIAVSSTTNLVGVSAGEMSKEDADSIALKKCGAEGDRNCRISISYENQCAAIAIPSSGKGQAYSASAATEEGAVSGAIESCSDTGGGKCVRFYSDCSKPVFIRY